MSSETRRKTTLPTAIEIEVRGARMNDLENVDVPLNGFVGVYGVSGSGKSTLDTDALIQAEREAARRTKCK